MKLKDKIKPSDPPLEEDMYDAVCVMVVDIGQQIDQKRQKVKNQIVFVFEIPSETVERDGEMVPRQLSRWFTYTASDRGALKPALTSWLGKTKMSEAEMLELELFDFAGMGSRLLVGINENNRNKIESIKPLKRGSNTPQAHSPIITYDIDEDGFQGAKWETLPEWLQETIKKSEQYQMALPDETLDMPASAETESDGDDCPI